MTTPKVPDSGAPLQDEVSRITDKILGGIGQCDLESALTVVCNIAGQLIAALAQGKPSAIQEHSKSVGENIRTAAIAKLLYDDAQYREHQTWQ